jgi:DNA modification methylase
MTAHLKRSSTSSAANTDSQISRTDIGVRQRARVERPPAALQADTAAANSAALRLFIEYVPTDELKAYSKGLRKHDEKHIAACMGSLRSLGFVAPIVIDARNIVVDGHALVVAAQRLGIADVPVVRLGHLSDELVQVCRVALNKLSEGARWDDAALRLEMIEIAPTLAAHDIEIEAIGFSVTEFDLMVAAPDAEPEEEAVPELAETAITQLGDQWLLGDHRLLCGNALSNEDFVKLMASEKARMAFCDAPYNLKVDGVISGLGKAKHRDFAMASGEMSRPEFIEFLTTYMRNCAAHSVDGAVHFACMDWRHILELISAGEAAFDKFLNLVVWAKTNAGMGTMYRSQHELIGVFKSGTAPHQNNFGLGETGRHRSNLWTVAGANTFRKDRDKDLAAHPTVKPALLVIDAIRDVSSRGEIVLDCFCGSGTTIIAAEKSGRRGYGIELDPLYVDVAVRRWQELTGLPAVLDGDGRTFDEISSARTLTEEPANG